MEFLSACVATVERGLIGWVVVAGVLTTFEILNPLGPMPLPTTI